MMNKFKIGDRVARNNEKSYCIEHASMSKEGWIGTILGMNQHYPGCYEITWDNGKHTNATHESQIDSVNNETISKKSIMTPLREMARNLFTKEPQKTFRKYGVTDDRGDLTQEGTEVFVNWLFKFNQADFKKEVIDPIIKEEEKKK